MGKDFDSEEGENEEEADGGPHGSDTPEVITNGGIYGIKQWMEEP